MERYLCLLLTYIVTAACTVTPREGDVEGPTISISQLKRCARGSRPSEESIADRGQSEPPCPGFSASRYCPGCRHSNCTGQNTGLPSILQSVH